MSELNPCKRCKSLNPVESTDLGLNFILCKECGRESMKSISLCSAYDDWNNLNKPDLNPCECGSTNLEVVESHVAGYSYISCECGRESVRSNSLTNLTDFWNHKNKPDSGLNRKVPVLDLERDLRAMAAFGEALAESARILKAFTEIYLEDTKNAKDRSN